MLSVRRTYIGVGLTIFPPLETWLHPGLMVCCSGDNWGGFMALGSAVE